MQSMTLYGDHVENAIGIKLTLRKVSHQMIISCKNGAIGQVVSEEKMIKCKIAEVGNLQWRPCFLSGLHQNPKFPLG